MAQPMLLSVRRIRPTCECLAIVSRTMVSVSRARLLIYLPRVFIGVWDGTPQYYLWCWVVVCGIAQERIEAEACLFQVSANLEAHPRNSQIKTCSDVTPSPLPDPLAADNFLSRLVDETSSSAASKVMCATW